MGFPNVDLFLCKTFEQRFADTQSDTPLTVDDLFEDMTATERAEIAAYIDDTIFTRDLRERRDGQRYVYIAPHFPMVEFPFPQIGVSLGSETTSDKYLGDVSGPTTEVKDEYGNTIGWDVLKGYYASATWNIDVVCNTKDEAIWLSRFCQLFVCQALEDLDAMGVLEVVVATSDMRLEQEHFPHIVFNRRVVVSAKVANTWKKRLSPYEYRTGVNLALATP